MFKKILVANRGEIALRVVRACREMGIRTVAVYSEADARSLHVRYADERVCIGPADGALSYRNVPGVLSAAEVTGADAIHPGYGFLAENAHFAEVCESIGITFIGPASDHIALLGNKSKARETMLKQGIPVLPGSDGEIRHLDHAIAVAEKLGYPVIVKASAGGGGRGMRVVGLEADLGKAILAAQVEARTTFDHDGVYIEKYVLDPRHVEIQVLADERGHAVHLGERDCSIQRRHQKLVEEAPSPAVDHSLRQEMGKVALKVVKAVNYRNAGTVEFLVDHHRNFYFMEVNPRIQVEHPVTEMVTGVDLVKEQIRVAAGLPLRFHQKDVRLNGHSIQCRINAECSETFAPSPGTVLRFHVPGGPGIRVDTALEATGHVHHQYDSLIAKLLAHGQDRDEAIARAQRALDELAIEGVKTTIPLHRLILRDPDFQKGRVSTGFLDRFLASRVE